MTIRKTFGKPKLTDDFKRPLLDSKISEGPLQFVQDGFVGDFNFADDTYVTTGSSNTLLTMTNPRGNYTLSATQTSTNRPIFGVKTIGAYNALDLNGTSQYFGLNARLPNIITSGSYPGVTIQMLIESDSSGSFWFFDNTDGARGGGLSQTGTGGIRATHVDDDQTTHAPSGNYTIQAGTSKVVTFSSRNNEAVRGYENGNLIAEDTNISAMRFSFVETVFCKACDSASGYFDGAIGRILIYNRALTPAEIDNNQKILNASDWGDR